MALSSKVRFFGAQGYRVIEITGPVTFTAKLSSDSVLKFETVVEETPGDASTRRPLGEVRYGSDLTELKNGGGNILQGASNEIPFERRQYVYMMATPPDASYIPNRQSHPVGTSAASIADQIHVLAGSSAVMGSATSTSPLLYTFDVDSVQPGSTFVDVYTPTSISEGAHTGATPAETILSGFMSKDDRELTQQVIAYSEYGYGAPLSIILVYKRTNNVDYTRDYLLETIDGAGYDTQETVHVSEPQYYLFNKNQTLGKSFAGFSWEKTDYNGHATTVYGDGVEAGMIVQEKYARDRYSIYFDTNGGTIDETGLTKDELGRFTPTDNPQVIYGGTVDPIAVPKRNGYTFAGWYAQSETEGQTAWSFTDESNPTVVPALSKDTGLVLVARWVEDSIEASSHIRAQRSIAAAYQSAAGEDDVRQARALKSLMGASARVNNASAEVDIQDVSGYQTRQDLFANPAVLGEYRFNFEAVHTGDDSQGAVIQRSIYVVPNRITVHEFTNTSGAAELAVTGDNILLGNDQMVSLLAQATTKDLLVRALSGQDFFGVDVISGYVNDPTIDIMDGKGSAYWTSSTVGLDNNSYNALTAKTPGDYAITYAVGSGAQSANISNVAIAPGVSFGQAFTATVLPEHAATFESAASANYALSARGFALTQNQALALSSDSPNTQLLFGSNWADVNAWTSTRSALAQSNPSLAGKLSLNDLLSLVYSNFDNAQDSKADEILTRNDVPQNVKTEWAALREHGKDAWNKITSGTVGEYELAFIFDYFGQESAPADVPIYKIKVSVVENESLLDNDRDLPSRITLRVWDAAVTESQAKREDFNSEFLRTDTMHCVYATTEGKMLGEPYVIEDYVAYLPDGADKDAELESRYKQNGVYTIGQRFVDAQSRNFDQLCQSGAVGVGTYAFEYSIFGLRANCGLRVVGDEWEVDADGTWAIWAKSIIRFDSVMAKLVQEFVEDATTVHPLIRLYDEEFNNVMAYEGTKELSRDEIKQTILQYVSQEDWTRAYALTHGKYTILYHSGANALDDTNARKEVYISVVPEGSVVGTSGVNSSYVHDALITKAQTADLSRAGLFEFMGTYAISDFDEVSAQDFDSKLDLSISDINNQEIQDTTIGQGWAEAASVRGLQCGSCQRRCC